MSFFLFNESDSTSIKIVTRSLSNTGYFFPSSSMKNLWNSVVYMPMSFFGVFLWVWFFWYPLLVAFTFCQKICLEFKNIFSDYIYTYINTYMFMDVYMSIHTESVCVYILITKRLMIGTNMYTYTFNGIIKPVWASCLCVMWLKHNRHLKNYRNRL